MKRNFGFAIALFAFAQGCGSCAGDDPAREQQQQQQTVPGQTSPRQIRAPLRALSGLEAGATGAPDAAP